MIREIDREQWSDALNELSRLHLGQAVDVEVKEKDIFDRIEARRMPLLGISTDHPGGAEERIDVIIGDSPSAHLRHTITHPAHVMLEEQDGGVSAIRIDSMGGSSTRVCFAQPDAANTPQAFA